MIVCLVSALVCFQPAPSAEEGLSPWQTPMREPWTISLEPSVAYFGFAGDIRLPGTTSNGNTIRLEDLEADNPTLGGFGELHLRRGKWRFTVSGYALGIDDTATAERGFVLGNVDVFAGERVDTRFNFAEFDASAAYRFRQYVSGKTDDGRDAVAVGLEALGGVRFMHIDLDFDVSPTDAGRTGMETTSQDVDELFAQPFAGLRLDMVFHERFTIDVNSEFGYFATGDQSSFTWNITVGLGWEVVDNLALQIGYRMMYMDLSADESPAEFTWSGSTAGLYFGARLEF